MGVKTGEFTILNKDDPIMYVEYGVNYAKSKWLGSKHIKIPMEMYPEYITFGAVLRFCESRQPPRTRIGIKELLRDMYGMREYLPIPMCIKSHGITHEGFMWLRFKGQEDVTYDSIKIRD